MSTARPRPEYGEYATPEEVAAALGEAYQPAPPVVPQPMAAPMAPPTGPPVARPGAVRAEHSGWRRIDRPITIALLLFGLFNVVQSAPFFLDFGAMLKLASREVTYLDLSSLTFGDSARFGGYALLAIAIVLLVAAAGFSYLALSRGRIAFWIPLVAAVLHFASYVVVIAVVLYTTPGFASLI